LAFRSGHAKFGHGTISGTVTVLLAHGRSKHIENARGSLLSLRLAQYNTDDQNASHVMGSIAISQKTGRCQVASTFVESSHLSSGFLPNESKSIWQPTPCLVWLGFCVDLTSRNISIPPERICNAEHVIYSIRAQFNTHFLLLGNWPVSWVSLFAWVLCLGTSPVS